MGGVVHVVEVKKEKLELHLVTSLDPWPGVGVWPAAA